MTDSEEHRRVRLSSLLLPGGLFEDADIADGAANPAMASEGLRQWRATVDAALRGEPPTEPTLPALADTR